MLTLQGVSGVGPSVARDIVEFFRRPANRRVIDLCLRRGVEIAESRPGQAGALAGRVVVFTGGLQSMTREEAEDMARACGARTARSVSAQTDLVVAGERRAANTTGRARSASGSSTSGRFAGSPASDEHTMENIEIAKTFDEVADLLEIQGANPFRVRAYRKAARTIGTLSTSVESILENNGHALEELPGIGADLAGKIVVMCRTGKLPLLKQLKRKTPESLVALLRIPGVGPKRAKLIYEKLDVKTLAQLEKAARAGRLSELRGMGRRSSRRSCAASSRTRCTSRACRWPRPKPTSVRSSKRSGRCRACGGSMSPAAFGAGRRPSATSTFWSPQPVPRLSRTRSSL